MAKGNDFTKNAERAVVAFEAIELGAVWAEALAGAVAAIEGLRSVAVAEVFPGVQPTSADVLSEFESFSEVFEQSLYTDEVIALHEASLEEHPELSRLIRSSMVRRRIAELASTRVVETQKPASELAEEALAKYELEISIHLAARSLLKPASTIIAVTVLELKARIDGARSRLEAHARASLEKASRERAEADAILQKESEARQAELDRAVAEAEAAVVRKERAATRELSEALAKRIEKLKVEHVRLEPRGFFSCADLIMHLKRGDFTRGKVNRISKQLDSAATRNRVGVRRL